MRLPDPCVVILAGPSGAGKSTWAQANFSFDAVVSSDRLRAAVGTGEHDLRASKDAFDVLELVVERRLKRRLTTVIDTLGLDPARRARWLNLSRKHRLPCFVVSFDVTQKEARQRLAGRGRTIPAPVLKQQFEQWRAQRHEFAHEGFDGVVVNPARAELVPPAFLDAPTQRQRQKEQPMTLRFGLQIPDFTWPGGPAEIGPRLRDIAQSAEAVGFDSIWVMDHFLQIPPVGPAWHDMLDSYTTLGYLAASTRTARLGTMVTGVTYRNVAHLAKIVATLDVLSGGRAICGIGAAWFEHEHRAYGWRFPPLRERFALLEDALQLLPLMWGPGSPPFEGKVIKVPEAMCYPRPLQERIPILVGGSGEQRTLKLVAQYADACNLFGEADVVRHKLEVLRRHCDSVGRNFDDIAVTTLSSVVVSDRRDLQTRSLVGGVDDHIGRFRGLADAGVHEAILSIGDIGDVTAVERFAPVIAAFKG